MGDKTKFREMLVEDLDCVMLIEKQNFSTPWHKEHFEYEISENPFGKMFVLVDCDTIIGYFGIWITFEECQITTITVENNYKGKGYGNKMMEKIIHEAKEALCERISLEVRESNQIARHLYEKYDFIEISRRPRYYTNPLEDAIVMMKGI